MSKYEQLNNNFSETEIEKFLVEGEQLIWSGKPKKSAFVINKCLNMLPIALIWGTFDLIAIIALIIGFINDAFPRAIMFILVPFFALHLTPVWIWLGNVLSANKRWQNTKYALTDKRIIITSGFIGTGCETIYYTDIKTVDLKVDVIDKLLKVGDIYFSINDMPTVAFLDIENVYEIYPKIQKIVLDIQTDIEFPNELRTEQNSGYKTKYNNKF